MKNENKINVQIEYGNDDLKQIFYISDKFKNKYISKIKAHTKKR